MRARVRVGLVWALVLHLLAYPRSSRRIPAGQVSECPQLAAVDRRILSLSHSQQQRSLHSNSTRLQLALHSHRQVPLHQPPLAQGAHPAFHTCRTAVANVFAMAPDPQQASSDADASAPGSSAVLAHRQRTKEDFDKILLDKYVNRDLVHTAAMLDDVANRTKNYKHMRNEADDYKKVRSEYRQWFPSSRLYGQGYSGYGNGHTDGTPKLVYPNAKPRLGHKKTTRLRIKRKELQAQADQVEELVPIRIDVDWDKLKLRDTFTWNLHDRVVPVDLFAAQLVEDLGLALPQANPVLDQVQHGLLSNNIYGGGCP
jgi:hypothetical protein